MASIIFFNVTNSIQNKREEQQRTNSNYLGFVPVATMQFLMRSAVRTVEEAVKSVVGPVYGKFHLLPDELLRHPDLLPDELIVYAHRKPEGSIAAAHRTPSASDIAKIVGEKCEPAANVLYERYEVKIAPAWQRLNRVRPFPRVAEKYNEAVMTAAEKGSAYLHVAPVERIAKVFKEKRR